ncbi:hypothetical protein [Candidatus Thiodictyon syntrophicum]|jgi:hypothetical protein|uniref:hypothetical protein n=1 Tax=Candidatus Thiodictyon syntrophicum TaxID=1166950 RepID=UPI0012FD3B93|nr:hypothetical protein [Candidatus Thiodictyon syntrophicum]
MNANERKKERTEPVRMLRAVPRSSQRRLSGNAAMQRAAGNVRIESICVHLRSFAAKFRISSFAVG